jgi:Anaphase promoting complex subunit 8 / Cdc23
MDVTAVKDELREALKVLRRRGLKAAAKICAELLVSTPPPTDPRYPLIRVARYQPPSNSGPHSAFASSDLANLDSFDYEADAESEETSEAYIYAKALFDGREYARAAVYLDKVHQSDVTAFSPLNFFLRCYSLYLVSGSSSHRSLC